MEEKSTVKEYYGKILTSSDDLTATNVVQCSRKIGALPKFVTEALSLVHEDITSRAYGCATAYPEALDGARILDLGSGCGRDCFVLSKIVGEGGSVYGLDMTDELLELSRNKIDYHTTKYGYSKPNIQFVKGYMEKMEEAGLQANFFDVIVSNCVISLCRDKRAVLREAYKVLKPGGELYFSDMYREGQLPADVMDDEKMWCEGLIGSLSYQDLHAIAKELGFTVPRMVRADAMPVLDQDIKKRLGQVRYASVTYRLFKKSCSNGPSSTFEVRYKGQIKGYEDALKFDWNYNFKKGEAMAVDSELGHILTISRFAPHFEVNPAGKGSNLPSLDVDPFKVIDQKTTPTCAAQKCA